MKIYKTREDSGNIDVGSLFIVVLVIVLIFGMADGIMTDRLGFSHGFSVLVLALITVGLLIYVWKKRSGYYEDMLKISFDEKTIKTAKRLKELKDEKEADGRI